MQRMQRLLGGLDIQQVLSLPMHQQELPDHNGPKMPIRMWNPGASDHLQVAVVVCDGYGRISRNVGVLPIN